jgi:sporulation protein YlmC with PRC-barrel domain
MLKRKWMSGLAAGALIGAFGSAGGVVFAEDHDCSGEDIVLAKTFLERANITMREAIVIAEGQCNGKAIQASLGCEEKPGYEGLKTDNYQICCLAKGELVELCVDSHSGVILAVHESTALPASFRLTSNTAPPSRGSMQHTFRIQKASDLIGKPVVNPRGERLGEVQDLAIDGERGRIAYVVLSFGGFLGMGEKWFAVPTGALTLPEDCKQFVLAVEKDRLRNAPGFEKDRWPQMGNPAWGSETHEFYGQRPYWMEEGEGSTPTDLRIQKASDILGRSVQNHEGEKLGNIRDLVIDPDRYRVAYVVLTFGGFLGMGDKLFAIPAGVLQMPGPAGHAVLNVDRNRLKTATGFDKNNWPNLADPTVAASTYEFYGQRPYWVQDGRSGK